MLLEMHLKALLQDTEPLISRYRSSPSLLALKCLPHVKEKWNNSTQSGPGGGGEQS